MKWTEVASTNYTIGGSRILPPLTTMWVSRLVGPTDGFHQLWVWGYIHLQQGLFFHTIGQYDIQWFFLGGNGRSFLENIWHSMIDERSCPDWPEVLSFRLEIISHFTVCQCVDPTVKEKSKTNIIIYARASPKIYKWVSNSYIIYSQHFYNKL